MKKQGKSTPARQRADQKRAEDNPFVQYELSKDQISDLKARVQKGWSMNEALTLFLEAGYRVAFKWDDYNNCYSCFVNEIDAEGTNGGKILTGRGGNPQSAFLESAYKHFVIFDAVWPEKKVREQNVPWDETD